MLALPAHGESLAPEALIPDPNAPAPGLRPLGDAPFGERIDGSTGEVAFHQADIVLEGIGPTIRIARTRAASGAAGPAAAFGDWALDVPRIETRVASDASVGLAWSLDVDGVARCSRFDAPQGVDATWEGYALHLGDGVAHTLLRRSPEWAVRPGLPGAFPIVTTSDIQVGCLPATRNGEPGEAFLAVAPDGLRYRLDWLVGAATGDGIQAAMFATRVEDRFGNWVDYAYEDGRLQSIVASDGREVAFEWSGARITRITTHPGSGAARTWRYEYAGSALSAVVLPDGSRWALDVRTTGGIVDVGACGVRTLPNAPGTGVVSTITTPSGLTGRFRFEARWQGRSGVPSDCEAGRETVPVLVSRWSLVQRTWSGPGVDARWDTTYGPALGSALRDGCEAGCGTSHWVDVTGPDGARVRETFATTWDAQAGKLLLRQTHAADGALLRSERFTYATKAELPFVARPGDALRGAGANSAALETRVPLRERVITQQGRDFAWRVAADCAEGLCFDLFGRPTGIERIGTHARMERTTYADHLASWVLGQVASVTRIDPASGATREHLRVEYDARALPVRRSEHGLLVETRTWHPDGTLASRSDGRDTPAFDTTIRYAGWTRGIPTTVTFPGGVRRRAGVEVDGTIRWIAAETGARTCFAVDAVGRRVRTTWPVETEPTRCGDDSWNETVATFEQATTATPLLAAGHWTRTERTGNGVRITSHDALWRPVLVEEHDAADIANTRRTTRIAYDAAGREVFRSWPSALAIPPLEGTTTQYDALARVVRVEKSSEPGTLASTTDYLDNFRTRATNARGHATTIERLRAYDTPDVAWPEAAAYPEGLHVDIERDAFDQPTRVTRRNVDGSQASTTHFVHDAHGRLCKTIEPERGATIIGRDANGNVAWTVSGSPLVDPDACQLAEAFADPRRIDRTWDARNRPATVAYPDGVGNRAHAYTADGLPSATTTWNTRAGRIVVNTTTWNARRLPVAEALTHPGEDTWVLGTTYDRNGHPTTQSFPNRAAVGLVPNALGQPTRIGTYVLGIRWHPDGTLAQFTHGNGIVHTTTRNARGLPERRRDAYGATVFQDESLDYDANGHLVAISDGFPGAPGDRLHVRDGLDRLVRVEAPAFGTAQYGYDAIGRLANTSIGGPHARNHHFCRDASGRLTNVKSIDCASGPSVIGIAHDAAGDPVRINAQAYAYDAGRRLRRVEGIASYEYDGHDRRVRATSLRGEGDILSQYDRDGRLVWQTDKRTGIGLMHLYLGNRLVAIREQANIGGTAFIRTLHTNVEGTPVVETSHEDRSLLRRSTYEPLGLLLDGPARDGVGFRGLVSDADTGLLYGTDGYRHPTLPEHFGACGAEDAVFDMPALDADAMLRAPPSTRC